MKHLSEYINEGIFDDNVTNDILIDEKFIIDYIKEKVNYCKNKHLSVNAFFPKEEGYDHSNMICTVTLYTHEYNDWKITDPNVTETLKITFTIEPSKNKKGITIHPDRSIGGTNEAFALHVFGKDKSWGGRKEISGIIFDDMIVSPISTKKQTVDFLKLIDSIFEGFEKCCKLDKICDWNWRKLKSKDNVLMLLDRLKEILPNPIAKLIHLNPRYTRM